MLILQKITYQENEGTDNSWKIRDVALRPMNMIVGLNATGKTRFLNVTTNLAKVLMKKNVLNGHWEVEFQKLNSDTRFIYRLEIEKGIVEKEEIQENDRFLLKRIKDKGQIYSFQLKKMIDISPPKKELILSVRRDREEFPFLEELFYWAEHCKGYKFTWARPNEIRVPKDLNSSEETLLEDLGATPYILLEAMKIPGLTDSIVEDFNTIGYSIDSLKVSTDPVPNAPPNTKLLIVKESTLNCCTGQVQMSQGMYRALSAIIIMEYILRLNQYYTVAIDDLGEGLDYTRAIGLIKLLFKKISGSKIQLIVTSNNRFLINAANLQELNILERDGHIVESFNYENSKKFFDDFMKMGLNNFDFFAGKMYKDNPGKNEK